MLHNKVIIKNTFPALIQQVMSMLADMNSCLEVSASLACDWRLSVGLWENEKNWYQGTLHSYFTHRIVWILIQPCKCYSAIMSWREMTCHLFSYLCVLMSPSSGQCRGYNIMAKNPFTIFLGCLTSRCSLIPTALRTFAMSCVRFREEKQGRQRRMCSQDSSMGKRIQMTQKSK